MPKQKSATIVSYKLRLLALAALLLTVAGGVSVAHADRFDDQINALAAQNASNAGVVNGLQSQANSYQAIIDQKQAQINTLQAQINANQAKQAQLQQQIDANKQQIAAKKASLSADIKSMYIDGQMSTIEQLATSKDLSDYVDKEEYRTTVQNQLNTKIKEIAGLQAQLQSQKQEVDQVIATTQAQNNQLAGEKAEQDKLLAFNEGQRSAYNQQISANSSKIASLRKQQVAANFRFIGGGIPGGGSVCGGGYPGVWCNAPQDSIIDSWGMYNRECVSYTAFRVAASGRYMPYWGGRGNANQWDDNARASGIPVDTSPRVGDVAISNAGTWGHAMYVESVNGGTITISQYNADFTGRYSTRTITPGGLYFIHF
ncbi:MAG TPA: CHAP domain-containing protein [Candidatus Saccharimonadales bacterium]|nr:CHAP domain-containing protein [Candidatus Saccharimonadales bacterium]